MKKLLLSVLLVSLSFPLFAAGPGWTVASEVKRLVVTHDGTINVRLTPELTGCTSFSGYGGTYASVYASHPGLKTIQSNLLAAYVSGKKVALYLSDDTCRVGEMSLGGTFSGN